jgi:hypothetical protein
MSIEEYLVEEFCMVKAGGEVERLLGVGFELREGSVFGFDFERFWVYTDGLLRGESDGVVLEVEARDLNSVRHWLSRVNDFR